jgi:hypothetical protein
VYYCRVLLPAATGQHLRPALATDHSDRGAPVLPTELLDLRLQTEHCVELTYSQENIDE